MYSYTYGIDYIYSLNIYLNFIIYIMAKRKSHAAVFHLRQENNTTSTVYQIRNINICTSEVLREKLLGIFANLGEDFEKEYREYTLRAENGLDDDVCSGIEYLYVAIAALKRKGLFTDQTITLLAAAYAHDPSSLLLSELAGLARESSVGQAARKNPPSLDLTTPEKAHDDGSVGAQMTVEMTLESVCEEVLNRYRTNSPSLMSRSSSCDTMDSANIPESQTRPTTASSNDPDSKKIVAEDKPDPVAFKMEEEDNEDDDEDDDVLNLGGISSAVRRAVMDVWRFGLFLNSDQADAVTEALRIASQRAMSNLVSRKGILLVLGPFLPEVASRHVISCPADEVAEVHLVDNSKRRLQSVVTDLMENKCITRRVFISDSGPASYVQDEPTWEGDRTYDVVTSIFSLHHLNGRDRRSVFRFVQAQGKTFIAVVWGKLGSGEKVEEGGWAAGLSNSGTTKHDRSMFDPAVFTSLVDSFETGMRQARRKFEEELPSDPSAREEETMKKRYALSLLARQFLVTVAMGTSAVNIGSRNPYSKRRSASLEPLLLSELRDDMLSEGLVVHSSGKLFDHWWCPVYFVEATSSLSQLQRSHRFQGSEEIVAENAELRARVKQLEQIIREKTEATG